MVLVQEPRIEPDRTQLILNFGSIFFNRTKPPILILILIEISRTKFSSIIYMGFVICAYKSNFKIRHNHAILLKLILKLSPLSPTPPTLPLSQHAHSIFTATATTTTINPNLQRCIVIDVSARMCMTSEAAKRITKK